jgi:hypothetical protein
MHPRTRELLDYLDEQRAVLRAAFDAVPAELRDRPPAPGQWSPTAIVEHLAIVDGRIARLLAKRIAEGRAAGVDHDTCPDPILPTIDTARVMNRQRRVPAPGVLEPTGLDADAAWAALERATMEVRASIAEGDGLALSTITHPHPLFGPLTLYDWIAFVGAHEARHAAQIRECVEVKT